MHNSTRRLACLFLASLLFVWGCGSKPAPPAKSQTVEATNSPADAPSGEAPANSDAAASSAAPTVETSPAPPAAGSAGSAQPASQPNADVVLTPTEYGDAIRADAKAFRTTNAGKVVEVSGLVEGYLFMNARNGCLSVGPGVYSFDTKELVPMAIAMPGQNVTLQGKCDSFNGVDYWSIVKVTGDPPPTISAEQLAKEFAADKKGVEQKYDNKFLVVTGLISKIDKERGTTAYLTPADVAPAVQAGFGYIAENNEAIKVGRTVRVLGRFSVYDYPALNQSVVLPNK